MLETRLGTILGTASYMSPEQVRGQPADARSDIFAFGCVLYEMLTGSRAFSRETVAETMTSVLNDAPPGLTELGVGAPGELQRVVVVRRAGQVGDLRQLANPLGPHRFDAVVEVQHVRDAGVGGVGDQGFQ